MEKYSLIKPDETLVAKIKQYRSEMLDANSSMDGTGSLRNMDNVNEWLVYNRLCEQKETVPEGLVTCDQYVYLRESDKKVVGMIQFRHYLNDFLENYGGHIGYSVCPSERQQGHAKGMLKECLAYCKEYGLDKVLITCDVDNSASERTIVANNGVYENTIYYEAEKKHLKRFWIDL